MKVFELDDTLVGVDAPSNIWSSNAYGPVLLEVFVSNAHVTCSPGEVIAL